MKLRLFSCLTLLCFIPAAFAGSREQTVRDAYREYIAAAVAKDPKVTQFFSQRFLAQELGDEIGIDEKVNADNLRATRLHLFVGHGIDPTLDPVSIKCSGDTCQTESPPRIEKTGPVTLVLTYVATGGKYLIDAIELYFH